MVASLVAAFPHPPLQTFKSDPKTTYLASSGAIQSVNCASTPPPVTYHHKRHSTHCQCQSKMKHRKNRSVVFDGPVLFDGRVVASVVINHDRAQATKSAHAAATHVSTPDNVQFCAFSDGSHGHGHRGGVGLAYRRQWLPKGWAEDGETHSGDMVKKAWPFEHSAGAQVMEGVGVMESLHAANEELERYLPVLTERARAVTVRATTDNQGVLRYIAAATLTPKQEKKLPRELVKKIHDLILALHDHGIKVAVELHWCPRNAVPQLVTADDLAGEAMKTGLGFCNLTQSSWFEGAKSVIMKELQPRLMGAVKFGGPVSERKRARRGRKKIATQTVEATSTTNADSRSQLPLPTASLPLKLVHSISEAIINTASTALSVMKWTAATPAHGAQPPEGPTRDNKRKRETEEEEDEESEGRPTKKPMSVAPPETQPTQGPANAGKRKREAEEDEDSKDSEGTPTKKPKPSPAEPIREPEPSTMLAWWEPVEEPEPSTMRVSWGLDLKYKRVFIADPEGVHAERPIKRAKFIRMETKSTLDTWEKNTYVNDGVSLFCLVETKGEAIPL